MSFQIPSMYEKIKSEELQDLNGQGYLLRHKKSGARIAIVENEDENKVFYIGFRTPPKNSTGVAHILEHSVLCGSAKFPAKDPFVELVKGSLNTFLNAMTYPDKTVYPIASCNDKDFQNLMHVYMDAVFYPNIYQRREIFMQEGWHYEMESEEDELTLNGVVYNEMKGAFSSPESILFRQIQNSLFPDTPYGVESGGDPSFIPDLSYEEFLEFHKKYYHPSNSYIYLYGNADMEEKLLWMDEAYLSKFEEITVDSEIALQQSFASCREITSLYSLQDGEEMAQNTYLSYNAVIGTSLDKDTALAFTILTYLLTTAPGAPVKQALIDAGIGKDILSSFEDDVYQPIFSVVAKNADESQKEIFVKTIERVLCDIVNQGVDEKSLRAAINYYEFKYREADYGNFPKGLILGLHMFGTWLYEDNEPFVNLKDNAVFERLKNKIGTGFYTELIDRYLLKNKHTSLVILAPKAGLVATEEEALKQKLAAYKQSLSADEVKKIVEDTKHLKEYQEEPSTKEELESIPMLSREDISTVSEPLYNTEKKVDGVTVVHHNLYTNGIAYLRLFFDLKSFTKEDVPYLSLLSTMLGYVDTTNYNYLELSNEINIHTGGMAADVKGFGIRNTTHEFKPFFELSTKALYNEMPATFDLLREIMFETKLSDTKRLVEIIDELISRMEMRFNSAGHSVAVERATSYYSEHALFKEDVSGIGLFKALKSMRNEFDKKKESIVAKLQQLFEQLFDRKSMIVSITADQEGYESFEKEMKAFLPAIKEISHANQAGSLCGKPEKKNEGYKTAMQVQYNAVCGNFMDAGYAYTGALRVLKVILGYGYLWNNVRVKGGAYGCMCGFSGLDGDAYLVSYRDPNLRETFDIFDKTAEYVANFEADEREITKYIIGAISALDTPLTPSQKGKRSLSAYFSNTSMEDIMRERDELLFVTVEKIRELSGIVKSISDSNCICTLGNENKIEENSSLYLTLDTLS